MTRGLSAIVLAAGHARRFGEDKLLQPFKGEPLLAHAIKAACAAPVDRVVVVKRAGAALDSVCRGAAAGDPRIALVEIASDALSASLGAGLAAARDAAGAFVFLGDMPLAPVDLAAQLARSLGHHFAAIPMFAGRPGHPALLSERACSLAAHLSGDQGAGVLLRQHASELVRVETHDDGAVLDVDTIADYEQLRAREGRS